MTEFKERTDEEILQRIDERKGGDLFGFEVDEYSEFLSYEAAKPFLKDGVKKSEWDEGKLKKDKESIKAIMLNYMPFAWSKANDCRGISAGRSLQHYQAWLWMAGDFISGLMNYEHYGKEKLIEICNLYGWDYKQWDDGVRVNSEMEL
jgi:hypothetical protein